MARNLNTVSMDLIVDFEKEILSFSRQLEMAISDPGVKMPNCSLNVILENFVALSTNELIISGVKVKRAQSISRYILEEVLGETMNSMVS